MNNGILVKRKLHFNRGHCGRRKMVSGEAARHNVKPTRIPRVSRLMALAIRFEHLVRKGVVKDYADIARLGHISRARVTQIMNLLNLAPDIQEAILFLPPVENGRDPCTEVDLRPIAATFDWHKQRPMWKRLISS